MPMSRKGADYCAVSARNDPWGRRTSAGGWFFGAEFIRYEPHSSDEPMHLFHMRSAAPMSPYVAGPSSAIVLMRKLYVSNFVHLNGHNITTLAEGPKHQLWELFLTHGRMHIAGGSQ